MKRKIVKQGAATMTVSLPSSWVKKNKLSSGDEIELDENHNSLIINTVKAKQGNLFSFDASSKKAMAARAIMGAYCLGYDEIEVRFSDPSVFKKIQDTVSELIGFEIINQSKNKCVIKELTGITEKDFNPVFRRYFRIVVDIFDESVDALKSNDKSALESLVARDKDVNKFCNLSIRYLNKSGADNSEMTTTYVVVCYSLEEVSDHFKEILSLAAENKLSKRELEIVSGIVELLKSVYEYTFKLDDVSANLASQKYEKLKLNLKDDRGINAKIYSLALLLSSRIVSVLGLQSPFSK